ncbi:MAG: lipopolysaccharide heptosyltransferase II [Pseudomonadota bacterium]|nr:lipopolysaccharide heptosyltransferase II [Pseudomonadota bacterium]
MCTRADRDTIPRRGFGKPDAGIAGKVFFRKKRSQLDLMLNAQKLLVVGPSWIGDMVMAQSLFKLLKQREPETRIDVLAPAWSEPLLARMPEVHRSITIPVTHGELALGKRIAVGRRLRNEHYQQAIVMPRSLKSALAPFFAGISVRTGFKGEWRYGLLTDIRRLDKVSLDQTVKRFLSLGLEPGEPLPPLPFPALRIDENNRAGLLRRLNLTANPAPVAMMPGASFGPAKCWPLEHYAELARRVRAEGRPIWILGGKQDQAAGKLIQAKDLSGIHNLCGLTRLEDTVDLLSLAAVTVTNDSGLMHVAAATAKHVVAIFGSTSPKFTPPLTERRTVQYLGLDCSPCFERVCPLEHFRCMKDISPTAVHAALMRLGGEY